MWWKSKFMAHNTNTCNFVFISWLTSPSYEANNNLSLAACIFNFNEHFYEIFSLNCAFVYREAIRNKQKKHTHKLWSWTKGKKAEVVGRPVTWRSATTCSFTIYEIKYASKWFGHHSFELLLWLFNLSACSAHSSHNDNNNNNRSRKFGTYSNSSLSKP